MICAQCKISIAYPKRKFCSKKCTCAYGYANNKEQYKREIYLAQKKRRKNYKQSLVKKFGGKCQRCGYDKSMRALSFHHLDRNKKTIAVSNGSASFLRMKIESLKCQLLCVRCHFELEDLLYTPIVSKSSNPNRYSQNRIRALDRKQKLVDLKGGQCKKCGYSQCLRALSFHHINPREKKFCIDLRSIGNRRWSCLLCELNKCDLLCVRCHFEIEESIFNAGRTAGLEPDSVAYKATALPMS